jgi:DNA polymerase-3 subunit beta
MDLQIDRDELSRALYRAQGIVEKKATMPILASVLLEAQLPQAQGPDGEAAAQGSGGRLKVSAFDMEIGVTGTHPAQVTKAGAVALKHKELYDIVRSLPDKAVSLKREANNRVRITSGAAEFNLVGQVAEDYPAFPRIDRVPLVPIEPTQLLEMIEKTQFAISTDETRHNLNGVYFESEGNLARIVATDGHRLSLAERPMAGDFQLKRGVIIPKKGLLELRRLLDEASAGDGIPCELGFTETSGLFRRGELAMVMRLIDGQFPDYGQVVPKEAEKVALIDRVRWLEALKRMTVISSDRATNPVRIELSEGTLKVSSQNPDLGDAKEELPATYAGASISLGFNARYLMDVLQALETDQVRLELCDDLSPGVIKPEAPDLPLKYTAVVMPMRI